MQRYIRWTPDEDALLQQLTVRLPVSWKSISTKLNRKPRQCYDRYIYIRKGRKLSTFAEQFDYSSNIIREGPSDWLAFYSLKFIQERLI
ncbi:Myb-like DNA-binding domain-containing protein [Spironucleus salmonicida]|uniref:Myb-like DNA-binding domain-containing protein n=1 Tax=Spironucleus salmonicida TaxID=348837 RepID=V6LGD0_9EUKA|nr:Myb-like DNA-binding domain-containing protein [Spironucleus salmonicida]|eukprot:EST43353.1 Myb-like DNA-binding domain-containing protein [Spironucleus salmonicida]